MEDLTWTIDGWQIHTAAHELRRGTSTCRLEPRAMEVLVRLAERPGAVVSRTELLDAVWGGSFVGDDALSAAIIKLRKAFGDHARRPRVIETVHKSGYRLIADVCAPRQDSNAPVERPRVTVGTLMRCVFRLGLSADTDPEDWKNRFDAVAAMIADVVRRHGGRSIRESSAVTGVFGAPIAQEHHAARAVQAAMALRATLAEAEAVWRIALVGGTILWTDDRAHGVVVQHSVSLCEAARPAEVLLARQTLDSAPGLLGTRAHEDAEDVLILGTDARWAGPWEAVAERSPLVGRDFELGRLSASAAAARDGRGQIVALSGEPGCGKSRLVREVLADGSAFIATASPWEAHTPFYPLRRGLMARLRVEEQHLADDDALRGRLGQSDPPASRDIPALLAVLRPDSDHDGWRDVSPEDRRARCLTALVDALIDNQGFGVMVFEDVQWADEPTLSFLNTLVNTLARRPLLVIVTYRPDFADPWTSKSYYTRLRLDPLGEAESAALLHHLVGDDPSARPWASAVIAQSDGTPLFLEEAVRSARSAGTLRGEPGRLTLARDWRDIDIPASVRAAVAERLDKLTDGAQQVLSLAAIIGREVAADLLSALSGDSRRHMEELQAAELLYGTGAGYVFKHALTQEVAYRAIPRSRRRAHHRRVADLLESGTLASPELIARHRAGADQHVLAIDAWLRAARSAITAAAFADALDHLDQSRSALAHVGPAAPHDLGLLIELATGSALMQSVGPADAAVETVYRRARELAVSGTPQQRFEANWGLWFVHLMRGDITSARPLGDELYELSGELDEVLGLEAHHAQWAGKSLAGDIAGVRDHAEIGMLRYRPDRHHVLTHSYGGHDPGVCAFNLGAMALWLLGETDGAREHCASAIALADWLDHSYTRLEASNTALNIALLEGDAATLVNHARVIHDLVRAGKLPAEASAYADGYEANALIINGDLAAGVAILEHAAPIWQTFWGAWCFPLDSAFAAALALTGETGRALTHVDERLALAKRSGAHWWDAEFHRVRGELLLLIGSTGEAETSIRTAVAVASSQGAVSLERRARSEVE